MAKRLREYFFLQFASGITITVIITRFSFKCWLPPPLMLSCCESEFAVFRQGKALACKKSQLTSANQEMRPFGIMSSESFPEWKLFLEPTLQTEFCRQPLMSLFSSVCWKENWVFFFLVFVCFFVFTQEEYSLCKSVMEGKALPWFDPLLLSELSSLEAQPSWLTHSRPAEWGSGEKREIK